MASNNSKIWELMGINASTGEGTYKNRMGLGNAITRDNGIPLDLSSLHATFDDAVVYAATKGIAYVGQILAAGDTVYVLTEQSQGKQKITSYRDSITGKLVTLEAETEYDVYLKPVGIIPTGSEYISVDPEGKITYTGPIYAVDNTTVEFGENNTIRLVNSDSAATGTLPMLEEVDGKLQLVWKTLEAIGAGDGNSVTTVESDCPCVEVVDEAEEGFEGHKYKVSLNISAEAGNKVEEKTDGIYVAETDLSEYAKTGDLVDYTVTCEDSDHEATEDAPAFKRHTLKQLGKTVCTIDIPKELVVEEGHVKEVVEADKPYTGAVVGDKYIELKITNQTEPLYIPAKGLVEYITVGQNTTVKLELDENHELTAEVKVSAEAGNLLEAKQDGLYVKHDLPTSPDEAAANQYVTAVDQKDGKITVTRKQISYNELADLPIIPGSGDFGVLALTGEQAIVVENKSEIETQDKVVKLLIDEANKGNVILTQTDAGLKAEVDLRDYAKTDDLPTLEYVDDTTTEKAKAANSELAIINITQDNFTLTEELAEFVTADILKNGAIENGGGLVDHAKVYAEQITWVAAEDGKSAKREVVPTTLDQVLALATAETVTTGEGEDVISFRTGHAGLMTPEEKFKLEKLVIDEDGSVGISGTISAENVIGLSGVIEDAITIKEIQLNGEKINPANKVVNLELSTNSLSDIEDFIADIDNKAIAVLAEAQQYTDAAIEAIPIATAEAPGLIKSAADVEGKTATNKVYVGEDGVSEVKAISTDILVQGTYELILNGGNANLIG